jgi:hypothetical protein
MPKSGNKLEYYFSGDLFAAVPVLEQQPTYSPVDGILAGCVSELGIVYGTSPFALRRHGFDKQRQECTGVTR